MKNYYVESSSKWFVVRCKNKKQAFSIGKESLGHTIAIVVREATESEVKNFTGQKGEKALLEED